MKDSDPRPMPNKLKIAYLPSLNLKKLFSRRNVFSPSDRLEVRDRLLHALIKKHGTAEVIDRDRVFFVDEAPSMRFGSASDGIDLLMSIEEYGGEEEVKRQLAFVMQPYWAKWWDEFDLSDAGKDYPLEWGFAARHVLGPQQFRWIAAQCARSALLLVRSPDRALCLDGIMNAERHAENPTEDTLLEMRASWDALSSHERTREDRVSRAIVAVCRSCCLDTPRVESSVEETVYRSSEALAYSKVDPFGEVPAADLSEDAINESRLELANRIRSLITPTLITHASRGLR